MMSGLRLRKRGEVAMIVERVEELIGNTPVLKISQISGEVFGANVFLKLECFNPAGSAKDRVARNMLIELEKGGQLTKDTVVIEPTSGNTGIGLAAVCASRGIKLIITMPDTMSIERINLMKAYGATVVLTDGSKGMAGAIEEAEKINKEIKGSVIAGQFDNPANPMAHYLTTGPEIFEALDGKVDIFVAGVGTGGTISGTGKYLKEKNKDVRIVGFEPENSAILSGKKPGKHGLQGIGAGFIPKVLDTGIIDEVICVSDEDAYKYGKLMATEKGVLVGITSGAAVCAALMLAKCPENRDKNIVALLPDTGERYLSTEMFK